ncbi:MAG: hypothetical protein M1816_006562 [Peltula sp. TS41687]|nr:MAG: hypothetical protein M1816_006562 [Peltula sp. TS41687]
MSLASSLLQRTGLAANSRPLMAFADLIGSSRSHKPPVPYRSHHPFINFSAWVLDQRTAPSVSTEGDCVSADIVDISQLLGSNEEDETEASKHPRASSVPPGSSSASGKRSQPPHPSETPAKKQSKWSAEEDALIIQLRGSGMKWEDISKRLPGRSAISCRLHYQNYLERRSEWDEDRKNKLARLFKQDMWARVGEELAVPWRAAEAMHWQLGEQDMARRAGVVPFSLSSAAIETAPRSRRGSSTSTRTRREPATRTAPAMLPPVTEVESQSAPYLPPPPIEAPTESEQPPSPEPPKEP